MTVSEKRILIITTTAIAMLVFVFLLYLSASLLSQGDTQANVSSASVVSLTNGERVEEGLPMLLRNPLLDSAAQMKAQDMAAKGYYAHVSPEGLTPMHWVDQAGYEYLVIGENLVVNRTDAEQVVDTFMGSPGHRANILRKDFTEMGVGVANGIYKGKDATFTVQIFAKPYGNRNAPVVEVAPAVKPSVAPSPAKPSVAPVTPPVPSNVPREGSVTATSSLTDVTRGIADNAIVLEDSVTNLIRPLVGTSTDSFFSASLPSPQSGFAVPSFSLNTGVPIELPGVSRLETQTLPPPLGSTWTMELRLFLESIVFGAHGMFAR